MVSQGLASLLLSGLGKAAACHGIRVYVQVYVQVCVQA